MFGAFIDDSGSDEHSHLMALCALVANKEGWDRFSDEWEATRKADKPIEYFKSSEAMTLSKCFAGFTREEADDKTTALTDVILKYIFYGMVTAVRWSDFNEFIRVLCLERPKGILKHCVKHPYYLSFHDVIASVAQAQIRMSLTDSKVDFMFDNQGVFGTRSIRLYNAIKPILPESFIAVLGEAHQGDDKVYLPLQAADLVAWQCRNRSEGGVGHDKQMTPSYERIFSAKKVAYHAVTRSELGKLADDIREITRLTHALLNSQISRRDP